MGRPVKVLLVSSHPVQYAAPLYRLYAADPRLEVTVAYCSLQGAEPGMDPEFGVEVAWDVPLLEGYRWVHPRNRSPRPGLRGFFGLLNPGLWTLIRKSRYDAVVLHTGYVRASFWIALAAAKATGSRVLFGTDATGLDSRDRKAWKPKVKAFLLPLIFSLADVVLAPSSGTRDFLVDLGIRPERIVLTPFVIDNDWWVEKARQVDVSAVRREWRVPAEAKVILFCAKLQPWKRPGEVLRAFAQVSDETVYLVFAGDGPLRSDLEREAIQLGIQDRIRFLGFVNQSCLPRVYAASDIYVLSSDYEPCSVAVIEAMLCGCVPVVSSTVWRGRQDTVVHGESGLVYLTGDVDGLARALRVLIEDSRLRNRLRGGAACRMASWTPKDNLRCFVAAVYRAVGRTGGSDVAGMDAGKSSPGHSQPPVRGGRCRPSYGSG